MTTLIEQIKSHQKRGSSFLVYLTERGGPIYTQSPQGQDEFLCNITPETMAVLATSDTELLGIDVINRKEVLVLIAGCKFIGPVPEFQCKRIYKRSNCDRS